MWAVMMFMMMVMVMAMMMMFMMMIMVTAMMMKKGGTYKWRGKCFDNKGLEAHVKVTPILTIVV